MPVPLKRYTPQHDQCFERNLVFPNKLIELSELPTQLWRREGVKKKGDMQVRFTKFIYCSPNMVGEEFIAILEAFLIVFFEYCCVGMLLLKRRRRKQKDTFYHSWKQTSYMPVTPAPAAFIKWQEIFVFFLTKKKNTNQELRSYLSLFY